MYSLTEGEFRRELRMKVEDFMGRINRLGWSGFGVGGE
jgi:hypothetical protein